MCPAAEGDRLSSFVQARSRIDNLSGFTTMSSSAQTKAVAASKTTPACVILRFSTSGFFLSVHLGALHFIIYTVESSHHFILINHFYIFPRLNSHIYGVISLCRNCTNAFNTRVSFIRPFMVQNLYTMRRCSQFLDGLNLGCPGRRQHPFILYTESVVSGRIR